MNVHGALQNRLEVIETLMVNLNLGILVCTETWMVNSQSLIGQSSFPILTSNAIAPDPQQPGHAKAGVAVICNPNLHMLPQLDFEDNEQGQWIVVTLGDLRLAGMYLPPDSPLDHTFSVLGHLSAEYPDDLIIVGDFNAWQQAWHDFVNNTQGNRVRLWMEQNNLHCLSPSQGPYWTWTQTWTNDVGLVIHEMFSVNDSAFVSNSLAPRCHDYTIHHDENFFDSDHRLITFVVDDVQFDIAPPRSASPPWNSLPFCAWLFCLSATDK